MISINRKVLIIHHFGDIGGAGVSLLDIIDVLKDDYDLSVACPICPPYMRDVIQSMGVNVSELRSTGFIINFYNGGSRFFLSFRNIRQAFRIMKSYKEIDDLIRDFNGELVIVNSMTLAWIGPIIKKYGKIAVCFHRESFIEKINIGTYFLKRLLRNYFNGITFISQYDLAQFKPADYQVTKVVYDRIREKRFLESKHSDKGEKCRILYLGGVSRLKGSSVIVDAMKFLDPNSYELLFVGNVEQSSLNKMQNRLFKGKGELHKIFSIIKRNNLEESIRFLPKTSHPENYYSECDMVVFPSTEAHQARPVYEAGISKIPIIISSFPNTTEFVSNEVTGFTFKPNNSKELANTIFKVRNMNRKKIEEIVERNYEKTLKNHSLSTLRLDLESFFLLLEGDDNR